MATRKTDDTARIVLAVTELTPVQGLWQEAIQRLRETRAELLALYVANDQWHRAATLPFTREISRASGAIAEFTMQRAMQLHTEATSRAQRQIQALASEANTPLIFEVLFESDQARIRELVAGSQNILIAPSFITRRPLYAELQKLDCRIVLIEAEEQRDDHR